MGVAAEILQNVFRAAKWPFAVDDPFVTEQLTNVRAKRLRVRKVLHLSVKADLAVCEGIVEGFAELCPKNRSEHLPRQKKVVMQFREHPAPMIERQPAGRNDAVHVGMVFQPLSPGVEHAEEANFGAETFGVSGDLDEGFSTEPQQQRVDEFLVLQCELSQKPRHRENDVSVGDGKKLFPSPLDPTPSSIGLTFWAMPITARVI